MTSKEHKIIAKKSLAGNWGSSIGVLILTSILSTLIIFIISILLALIINFVPKSIPDLIISVLSAIILLTTFPALAYLPLTFFLRIKRNEQPKVSEFLTSFFSNFRKCQKVWINTFISLLPLSIFIGIFVFVIQNLLLPLILFNPIFTIIIPITALLIYILLICLYYKAFLQYVLAIYIIYDNPDLLAAEALLQSKIVMEGYKKHYFWLELTFIGWFILSSFTFGLPLLFVLPYMYTAKASFYDDLIKPTSNN